MVLALSEQVRRINISIPQAKAVSNIVGGLSHLSASNTTPINIPSLNHMKPYNPTLAFSGALNPIAGKSKIPNISGSVAFA